MTILKSIKIVALFLLFLSFGNFSCTGQGTSSGEKGISKAKTVSVYYFHYSRRCMTCKNVQEQSKKTVNELYGDKVTFKAYNLEKPEGEKKANELGVSGQTLLIVGGDTKINITNEGFMYASRMPDKFKQIVKEKTDPLL